MNAPQSADPLGSAAAQAALVAGMCRPEAYAALNAVTEPIQCIETHVSWVFLTGPFAYKLKKPVRLSFLDYSTADRRAAFCHEELRLNRRHAPGLYVEVVAVTGTPASAHLQRLGDGTTEPLDHALRMVQFDPRLELGHLLEHGDIAQEKLVAFGARIALMQVEAPPVEPSLEYGLPEGVHRITLANFDDLAGARAALADPSALPAGTLDRLQQRARGLFEQCRERILARLARGRVREGHGDLHCGNVVLWQDALVAFDGIEFDPALRWIDVASDVAFLTMDLAARGRHDLRRAVLQGWLTESGDFDALALLPYFELYRALVRAKVAALRSLQSPGAVVGAFAEVRRYLDWAASRLERPPPALIVMVGFSGSGKTWLAQRIASRMGALIVRSDIERKRLAGLQPLQASGSAADDGLYTLEFNTRTYLHLNECVANGLAGGERVVVDAASLRRTERERFIELARQHDARVTIVHCTAPIDIRRRRVTARAEAGTDASEATADLLDRQQGYWEEFGPDERKLVLAVDTTDPTAVEHALHSVVATHQLRAMR